MKILLINIQYYPYIEGGAEISTQKLAEELAKKNEVYVLCDGEVENGPENINGVIVYRTSVRISYNNIFAKALTRNFKVQCGGRIRNIISIISPDIIHTNNLHEFSVIVWKIATELRIPIVHTLRDYSLMEKHLLWYEVQTNKYCTKYVTAVTAPSKYTLCKFVEEGFFSKTRIRVAIPNAIDFSNSDWEQCAKRKNISSGCVSFAYCGRFSKDKGIDWLIKVFSNLKYENARLHLFGKGELDEISIGILKRNHRIVNHGFCDEETLREELKKCDVVIVPSLWDEPFGRTILDGYRMACPVICTARGGMPEIVEHEKTGYLVSSETDAALLEAMEYFCNSEKIVQMLPNVEEKLQEYTISKQVESFYKIYSQCLQAE